MPFRISGVARGNPTTCSGKIRSSGLQSGEDHVDWGNAAANASCGQSFVAGSALSCTYNTVGTYRVSIGGDLTGYGNIAGQSTNSNITRVIQWGNTGLTSPGHAFAGATNLTDVPPYLPAGLTGLGYTFNGASSLNDPDIRNWDTSNIVWLVETFRLNTNFNVDISGWDISSAQSIYGLFDGASSFNQDISGWNVSGISQFTNTFKNATSFSQDLSGWDVSGATSMPGMFNGATSFSADLSGWCVGNIATEPADFMTNSFITNPPAWGTCP